MFDFHKDTIEKVQRAVSHAYATDQRIRVWYGDTTTGKAWPEENDVTGTIGRSTGPQHAPLLVNNKRSMGGPALLDHCIVRIDTTSGRTLYQHPTFSAGIWLARDCKDCEGYAIEVLHNGEPNARFETQSAADRYIEFMLGNRYAK